MRTRSREKQTYYVIIRSTSRCLAAAVPAPTPGAPPSAPPSAGRPRGMLQAYQQLYGTPGQAAVATAGAERRQLRQRQRRQLAGRLVLRRDKADDLHFAEHLVHPVRAAHPPQQRVGGRVAARGRRTLPRRQRLLGPAAGLARAGGAAAFDGGVHYAATTGILTDADDVEGFKGQDRLNDAWEKLITTSAIDDAKAQLTWMVVNFALDGTVQYASALYDSYKEAQALVKAGKLAESEVQAAAKGLQAELKVVEGAATTPCRPATTTQSVGRGGEGREPGQGGDGAVDAAKAELLLHGRHAAFDAGGGQADRAVPAGRPDPVAFGAGRGRRGGDADR